MKETKVTDAGTTVPCDRSNAQLAKNAVGHFKALKNKGKEVNGPTALRSFWNLAALAYVHYLQQTQNQGRTFDHCDQLPRGRTKGK